MVGRSSKSGAVDVKVNGSVLEGKSSLKVMGVFLSFKLDWCSYNVPNTKTASKVIGALIRYMKFLSPEVVLYFYKSTIRPCMKNLLLTLLTATWI